MAEGDRVLPNFLPGNDASVMEAPEEIFLDTGINKGRYSWKASQCCSHISASVPNYRSSTVWYVNLAETVLSLAALLNVSSAYTAATLFMQCLYHSQKEPWEIFKSHGKSFLRILCNNFLGFMSSQWAVLLRDTTIEICQDAPRIVLSFWGSLVVSH